MSFRAQSGVRTASARAAALCAGGLAIAMMLSGCSATEPEHDAMPDLSLIDVPEAERAALEDGKVTYQEYREAMVADRDCVIDAGLFTEVGDISEDGLHILGFEANVDVDKLNGASPPSIDQMNEIRRLCETDFSRLISRVWLAQRTPSVEEREALRPKVIECLTSAGLDLTADSTQDEVFAALTSALEGHQEGTVSDAEWTELGACQTEYADYFLFAPAD